jgi:hypothetical protein
MENFSNRFPVLSPPGDTEKSVDNPIIVSARVQGGNVKNYFVVAACDTNSMSFYDDRPQT